VKKKEREELVTGKPSRKRWYDTKGAGQAGYKTKKKKYQQEKGKRRPGHLLCAAVGKGGKTIQRKRGVVQRQQSATNGG